MSWFYNLTVCCQSFTMFTFCFYSTWKRVVDKNYIARLLQAFKAGIYGPRYVWILVAWYVNGRIEYDSAASECTQEQFNAVANGVLLFSRSYLTQLTRPGVSGYTATEIQNMFNQRTHGRNISGASFMPLAYDGTWLLALGLNKSYYALKKQGENRRYYVSVIWYCNSWH